MEISSPNPEATSLPSPNHPQYVELARKLKQTALLEGDFVLHSGARSRYYFDKYLMEADPEALSQTAEVLTGLLPARDQFDLLAGVELGGIPLVTALSLKTGIPALFVRKGKKDYGTAKQIEGSFQPGERVVLVEDVVTTGKAALEAIEVIRQAGLRLDTVVAVVDRESGAVERFQAEGISYRYLFTLSYLLSL